MTETAASAEAAGVRAQRLALGMLLLSTVIVSISGVLVRLSELGPVSTAFWRVALAVPPMLIWAAAARHPPSARPVSRLDYILLVAGGLMFGGAMCVWNTSLLFTSVANSTLLSNSSPIIVVLGAWLIFGQPPTRIFMAGLAVAVGGAAILMSESLSLSVGHLLGDALSVATAMIFGAYILVISRLRRRLPTSTIMLWTCLAGAVPLLPLALAMEDRLLPASLEGWAIVLALAIGIQTVGQSLLTQALAHLPATFGSVGYLLVPVFAATLAWLLLGEAVGPVQVAWAAVVLAGVAVARLGSR